MFWFVWLAKVYALSAGKSKRVQRLVGGRCSVGLVLLAICEYYGAGLWDGKSKRVQMRRVASGGERNEAR